HKRFPSVCCFAVKTFYPIQTSFSILGYFSQSTTFDYNSTQDDGTGNTIYINTPSLSVNLSDAGSKKAVYSFTVQGKSARSYNRATVKNIASKSISAAVKDEFAKDFSNFMGIESASADILSLFGL
ncbi:MAG: hypothetical protein UHY90_07770, partial [Treponema sp.]|nr:hypothetical protein [Treponema sp.]